MAPGLRTFQVGALLLVLLASWPAASVTHIQLLP
jgi:hypothetical protein